MDYLYITEIFTNTNNIVGFDITQNNLDKTDFETNYKSSCVTVNSLSMAGTTVRLDKTYTQFKALITGDLTWADVKLIVGTNRYEIFLITDSPL